MRRKAPILPDAKVDMLYEIPIFVKKLNACQNLKNLKIRCAPKRVYERCRNEYAPKLDTHKNVQNIKPKMNMQQKSSAINSKCNVALTS